MGVAAISLGKHDGAEVIATTCRSEKEQMLGKAGAHRVIIDEENKLQDAIKQSYASGVVNKLLDLVGASTAAGSIRCLAPGGVRCSAGTLGKQWAIPNFLPNFMLPIGRYLTSNGETIFTNDNTPWEELLELVRTDDLRVQLGMVYRWIGTYL